MNTEKVFKKLFNVIEKGDLVQIKGTPKKGTVANISIWDDLTIVHIDTGEGRLIKVYDLGRLKLI